MALLKDIDEEIISYIELDHENLKVKVLEGDNISLSLEITVNLTTQC